MKLILTACIILSITIHCFCFQDRHPSNLKSQHSQLQRSYFASYLPRVSGVGVHPDPSYAEHPFRSVSVFQFQELLQFFYGDGFLKKFLSYGNYCGLNLASRINKNQLLASELEPIDVCDHSCKIHDDCWGRAVDTGVCQFIETYLLEYKVNLTLPAMNMCSENPNGSCKLFICSCDLEMAQRMGQLHDSGDC